MKRTKRIAEALTIDTNAYTANDVVGGLLTFEVGAVAGGGGQVERVLIGDDDNEKAAFSLYLFNEAPTTIADDAAFAPTIADLNKLVDLVTIAGGDYTTVGANAYALLGGHEDTAMEIPFLLTDGNLYGYLVATGTPTYTAATDLTVTLTVRVE